jgi:BirA family biotin operon repressor/biotin-[acetyl-CoA-carboxylase] ligase
MGSAAVQLRGEDPPAPSLSLLAGLVLHRTLWSLSGGSLQLMLKWPNDLLLNGAKLAGILLERSGEWIVIGIGANLLHAPLLPDRKTTALADHGCIVGRDDFAQCLAEQFECAIKEWRGGAWPTAILQEWQACAHPVGTNLIVGEGEKPGLTGAFDGLERDGSLRLRRCDGSVLIVRAGDVGLAHDYGMT